MIVCTSKQVLTENVKICRTVESMNWSLTDTFCCPLNVQSVVGVHKLRLIKATFFWDYSVYSNSGIDGPCVLLGAIPIPEWTKCYSVHSAPDSRMDGIVFRWENCTSAPVSFDHFSYSVFGIAHDLFYWELIFCVFCYSYSEIGNGIVLKECALNIVKPWVLILVEYKFFVCLK